MKTKTKPEYYQPGKFDVVAFCQKYKINFALGNVVKYIVRAGKKEGEPHLVDLQKAQEYLRREIEYLAEEAEK